MKTRIMRQEVEQFIARNVLLVDIERMEPTVFSAIIERALTHPEGYERWPKYSLLKLLASRIVGWDAAHPELSTTSHYEAMIDLINRLLPIASEQDRTDEQTRDEFAALRLGGDLEKIDLREYLKEVEQRYWTRQSAS